MPPSAYIHIPFCSHKCEFCDFAAFAGVNHLEDDYAQVVQNEIRLRLADGCDGQPLSTIFWGGGTPGLVKPETLGKIQATLNQFHKLAPGAEVSLETTPHSITPEKAKEWLALGINRISIGVESLQDSELKAIGRDHSRSEAEAGIAAACAAGFTNVSCDFMYSLPTQTEESWRDTLEQFVQLSGQHPQIKHVSAYGLHIANNSPLYSRFPKDSPSYPDEAAFESMYDILVETIEGAGFLQYEVSNFARPGYESTHNLAYWQNREYYAFGVGAHRYVNCERSSNWRSLSRYMKDCLGNETHEVIDFDTRTKEAIMLGLRMRKGIELAEFQAEFGFNLVERNSRSLKQMVEGGLVELADGRLRIRHKGVPISNSIIAALI